MISWRDRRVRRVGGWCGGEGCCGVWSLEYGVGVRVVVWGFSTLILLLFELLCDGYFFFSGWDGEECLAE